MKPHQMNDKVFETSVGGRKWVAIGMWMLSQVASVNAATFSPTTGDWTTGSNWSTGIAPGVTGATDNAGTIGSGKTATLDNSSNVIVQNIRPDIQPGGTLTIAGSGSAMTFDQPGIFGTLNMNGGTVSVLTGGQKVRMYLRGGFDSVFNMNNGTWSDTSIFRGVTFGTPSVSSPATMTMNMNGGVFATNLTLGDMSAGDYMTSTLNVIGAGATLNLLSLNWSMPTTNANGSSVIDFALENDGSFSQIAVTNALTLGDGSTRLQSDLSVNVTAFQNQSAVLDLFSYGSLSSTFGSVDVYYLDGGSNKVSLDPGLYSIDYGSGSNDTITLTVIPEPSTLALFGLAGVVVLMGMRRKRG